MKKTFYAWLEVYSKVPGSVWVDLWGIIALVRFAIGKPVDPIFLGVLGIYAGAKAVNNIGTQNDK